ncbi:MAG: tetratricopeptide repeat protein [Alphaproteobacteria bacterium]
MKRLISAAVAGAMMLGPAAAADLAAGMLAFDQGDYPGALAEWTPLADSGDATAQSLLALLYRTGEGVRRDATTAAIWYRRAAMQGHPYAQYNLGEMYRAGDGVPQDLVQAYVWFALAAQQIPPGADGTSSASRARDAVGARLSAPLRRAAQDQIDIFLPSSE